MLLKKDTIISTERRKYSRYKLQEGVLAFFGATPCFILDISPAGMAVNYIVLHEHDDTRLSFDLFSSHNEAYLAGIPGKFIREDNPDPAPCYSTLHTRKLCVMFADLTVEQMADLNQFIHENSIILS